MSIYFFFLFRPLGFTLGHPFSVIWISDSILPLWQEATLFFSPPRLFDVNPPMDRLPGPLGPLEELQLAVFGPPPPFKILLPENCLLFSVLLKSRRGLFSFLIYPLPSLYLWVMSALSFLREDHQFSTLFFLFPPPLRIHSPFPSFLSGRFLSFFLYLVVSFLGSGQLVPQPAFKNFRLSFHVPFPNSGVPFFLGTYSDPPLQLVPSHVLPPRRFLLFFPRAFCHPQPFLFLSSRFRKTGLLKFCVYTVTIFLLFIIKGWPSLCFFMCCIVKAFVCILSPSPSRSTSPVVTL